MHGGSFRLNKIGRMSPALSITTGWLGAYHRMTEDNAAKSAPAKGVSFLDATEEVCEGCPWLVPVYYLRVMLAANELLRAKEIPAFLRITARFIDDDSRMLACFDDDLIGLHEKLAQFLGANEAYKLLLFSERALADTEVAVLQREEPTRYELLRAVSNLWDVRQGFCLNNERREPVHVDQGLIPNPFIAEPSPYGDEIRSVKKRRQDLHEKILSANGDERASLEAFDAALAEYLETMEGLRSPLLVYAASMKDFVKLCQWKHLPLPKEYQRLVPNVFPENHEWLLSETSDFWELPKAVSAVFGDIGDDWETEAELLQNLSGDYDGPEQEDENVSEHWRGVVNTLEYRKAQTALLGGLISGFFDPKRGVYQVTPASFANWVKGLGVEVPAVMSSFVNTASVTSPKNTVEASHKPTTSKSVLTNSHVDEDPSVDTWLEFSLKSDGEGSGDNETLFLQTVRNQLTKSKTVTFGPNTLGKKLMLILLVAEEGRDSTTTGYNLSYLLQELYGVNLVDLRNESNKYITERGINAIPSSPRQSKERKVFEDVVRPKLKPLQSLIDSIRKKFVDAELNTNILPKLEIAPATYLTTKVRLQVRGVHNIDRRKEEMSRDVSFDTLYGVSSSKRQQGDDGDDD